MQQILVMNAHHSYRRLCGHAYLKIYYDYQQLRRIAFCFSSVYCLISIEENAFIIMKYHMGAAWNPSSFNLVRTECSILFQSDSKLCLALSNVSWQQTTFGHTRTVDSDSYGYVVCKYENILVKTMVWFQIITGFNGVCMPLCSPNSIWNSIIPFNLIDILPYYISFEQNALHNSRIWSRIDLWGTTCLILFFFMQFNRMWFLEVM